MAADCLFFDPAETTLLYIVHIESVTLCNSQYEDVQAVLRWYVDAAHHCSEPVVLKSGVQDFSNDNTFHARHIELQNVAGVVASADIRVASQQRWALTEIAVESCETMFVHPDLDPQAEYVHSSLFPDARIQNSQLDWSGDHRRRNGSVASVGDEFEEASSHVPCESEQGGLESRPSLSQAGDAFDEASSQVPCESEQGGFESRQEPEDLICQALKTGLTECGSFYILYIDRFRVTNSNYLGKQVVCRWYLGSSSFCSEVFELTCATQWQQHCCSFLVVPASIWLRKDKQLIATLSEPEGAHLCAAFLDLNSLSTENRFSLTSMELQNQDGTLAVADLHSAMQQRWTEKVEHLDDAVFVFPDSDPQASHVYTHILATSCEQQRCESEATDLEQQDFDHEADQCVAPNIFSDYTQEEERALVSTETDSSESDSTLFVVGSTSPMDGTVHADALLASAAVAPTAGASFQAPVSSEGAGSADELGASSTPDECTTASPSPVASADEDAASPGATRASPSRPNIFFGCTEEEERVRCSQSSDMENAFVKEEACLKNVCPTWSQVTAADQNQGKPQGSAETPKARHDSGQDRQRRLEKCSSLPVNDCATPAERKVQDRPRHTAELRRYRSSPSENSSISSTVPREPLYERLRRLKAIAQSSGRRRKKHVGTLTEGCSRLEAVQKEGAYSSLVALGMLQAAPMAVEQFALQLLVLRREVFTDNADKHPELKDALAGLASALPEVLQASRAISEVNYASCLATASEVDLIKTRVISTAGDQQVHRCCPGSHAPLDPSGDRPQLPILQAGQCRAPAMHLQEPQRPRPPPFVQSSHLPAMRSAHMIAAAHQQFSPPQPARAASLLTSVADAISPLSMTCSSSSLASPSLEQASTDEQPGISGSTGAEFGASCSEKPFHLGRQSQHCGFVHATSRNCDKPPAPSTTSTAGTDHGSSPERRPLVEPVPFSPSTHRTELCGSSCRMPEGQPAGVPVERTYSWARIAV